MFFRRYKRNRFYLNNFNFNKEIVFWVLLKRNKYSRKLFTFKFDFVIPYKVLSIIYHPYVKLMFLECKNYLTHISLASLFGDLGKQCRPRSDATERGVWSGSDLFANRNFYQK